ncbi:hypothetical protein ACLIA0_04715 [Bacillaceae bacterium W0354]
MREIKLSQINKVIEEKRANVSRCLLRSEEGKKLSRNRSRSIDEQKALTELTILSWEKAVNKGKIKYLGDRKLYYDYR